MTLVAQTCVGRVSLWWPVPVRPIRSSPAPSRGTAANRCRFGRWLLGSGLYSLTLGYRSPRSFFAVAPDRWPGDPAVGQRLIVGELLAHGSAGAGGAAMRRPAVAAHGCAAPCGSMP